MFTQQISDDEVKKNIIIRHLNLASLEKDLKSLPLISQVERDKYRHFYYLLHFPTNEAAGECLDDIISLLEGEYPSRIFTFIRRLLHQNYFYVHETNWQTIREILRKKAPSYQPDDVFFIKSIRGDKQCYYHRFIEELISGKKFPKRLPFKKDYTVTGKRIYTHHLGLATEKIPLKEPQYSAQEKAGFTNFQSTSVGTEKLLPRVFGFDKRNLAGTIMGKKAVLPSERLFVYDNGTYNPPYESNSKSDAKEYAKKNLGSMLFSPQQFGAYIKKLSSNPEKYSEPLMRLKWLTDGSCAIFIGTDNLSSRLLAKQYADSLLIELKKAGQCPPGYQVPICFYIPESPELLFKIYTEEEYQFDRMEAQCIYKKSVRKHEIHANDFNFLLGLSADEIQEALNSTVKPHTLPLALHLLYSKEVHLYRFLTEKIAFDLAESVNQYKTAKGESETQTVLKAILFNAAESGDLELIHTLLKIIEDHQFDIKINMIFIHTLLGLGLTEMVRAILSSQLQFEMPITPVKLDIKRLYLDRSLILAVKHNDIEITRWLLKDADVNVSSTQEHHYDTALYTAAKNGNIDMVELLLSAGANLNIKRHGVTALSVAAYYGHMEIVELLFAHGAAIDDINDQHALNYAAAGGQIEMVKFLLQKGANIEGKDNKKPLIAAILAGRVDIVHLLLAEGAKFTENEMDYKIFRSVVEKGNTEMVAFLVKNAPEKLLQGMSLKHLFLTAIDKGHLEIAELLLENGVEMLMPEGMTAAEKIWQSAVKNIVSDTGSIALKLASLFHKYTDYYPFYSPKYCVHIQQLKNMAKIIADKLANHSEWDLNQCKSFINAYIEDKAVKLEPDDTFTNLLRFIKLLKNDPNTPGSLSFFGQTWEETCTDELSCLLEKLADSYTPITQKDIDQIKTLIKNGACLSQTIEGRSLLEVGVYADATSLTKNWRCVKAMLSATQKTNKHDIAAYNTILLSMVKYNQYHLLDKLLKAGADPNTTVRAMDDTKYCLHLAIKNGNHQIAQLLLEHEANINILDDKGNTCLALAAKNNDRKMAALLLKHGAESDSIKNLKNNEQEMIKDELRKINLEERRYEEIDLETFERIKDYVLMNPLFKALKNHGKHHKQAQISLYQSAIIHAENIKELVDALDSDPKIEPAKEVNKNKKGCGTKLKTNDRVYSMRETWLSHQLSFFGIKVKSQSRSNRFALALREDVCNYANTLGVDISKVNSVSLKV